MKNAFNDLPEYLEWANTRTVQMLRAAPAAAGGVPILAHLIAVELIWAERLMGQPASCPQRPEWTLPESERRISGNAALYRSILQDPAATEEVRYRNFQGEEFTAVRSDILWQVMAHGAYHRGQISQEVRRSGGEILDTDFILFQRR